MGNLQHLLATGDVPYFVVGLLTLVGLAVGRMICGYFCPFGFVQDLLYKVPSRKLGIPDYLTYTRFAVLACLIIGLPMLLSPPTEHYCKYMCPSGTLFGGIPLLLTQPVLRNELGNLFYWKYGFLIAVLILAVISKRPFCRVFCPLGAFYGIFNRVSVLRLRVSASTCTKCNRCKEVCPVSLSLHEDPDSTKCVRCLDCTFCPSIRVTTAFSKQLEEEPVEDKPAIPAEAEP